MTQTFRDFIVECETFEYSQEYYEMLKECLSIELMEQYLANQEFISECVSEYKEDGIQFTEGYFFEADSEETKKNLTNNLTEKKKNLFTKIINSLKKIWNVICNFFIRIWNNINSSNQAEKRDKAVKLLNEIGKSGGDQDKIKEQLKKIVDDADSRYLSKNGVKISDTNKLSNDANILFSSDKTTASKLAFALNSDTITFDLKKIGAIHFCSIETFIRAFNSFDPDNQLSLLAVMAVIEKSGEQNERANYTIKALNEKKDYKDNIKKMKEIDSKIKHINLDVQKYAPSLSDVGVKVFQMQTFKPITVGNSPKNSNSSGKGKLPEISTALIQLRLISGLIISTYTAYYQYRLEVINKLTSLSNSI